VQILLEKLVSQAEIVFWDFDGVIKDSVEVKSIAFEELFSEYNQDLADRVRDHHERNGGLSRFEKIPLYLSWSSEVVTDNKIQELCNRFSLLVKQAVIDSPWIHGFLEFIERHYKDKKHILVTATPTKEIEEILQSLNIRHFFFKVYGAPDAKGGIINQTLREMKISPKHAIMLGDSVSDFKAAKDNNVLFFLRSTRLNKNLQSACKEYIFKDFANE
jgi:HAD superfamily hydrolase (TIGR01549 family)|tara:strand:- start:895 stop:1545 length:651 start_codon:yes stop_codon:yes gene_type:complete